MLSQRFFAISGPPAAKRLKSGGPRLTLQLTFSSTGSMAAFKERMESLKIALVPVGSPPLEPVELMAKLADAHLASQTTSTPVSSSAAPAAVAEHFLPSVRASPIVIHCKLSWYVVVPVLR